jgi:hypothetical protein
MNAVTSLSAENMSVIYCGDAHEYRRKRCGLSLMDQLLSSVESIRRNWSASVEVLFVHTLPLGDLALRKLEALSVRTVQVEESLQPDYLLGNKILVGTNYTGTKDILFLDCDTRVHRPPVFDVANDMLVTYDALQAVSLETYRQFYDSLNIGMPQGAFFEAPAYQYYFNGAANQFPQFNSGVYFLKKQLQEDFYETWRRILVKVRKQFSNASWEFYMEQLSFTAAIMALGIDFGIFPPGINFICTPRAPYLEVAEARNYDRTLRGRHLAAASV